PKGGAQNPADVIPRYARDGEWSQAEGFAVVMALDRLVGPAWKKHAFGDGARTVLEMLDDALAEGLANAWRAPGRRSSGSPSLPRQPSVHPEGFASLTSSVRQKARMSRHDHRARGMVHKSGERT